MCQKKGVICCAAQNKLSAATDTKDILFCIGFDIGETIMLVWNEFRVDWRLYVGFC